MVAESVRIDEMSLLVSGLSVHEARRFGEAVARRVAQSLRTEGQAGRLGALDLRVPPPPGATIDRLVEIVAEQILLRLG